MLAALAAPPSPFRLRCIHVEHGIRPAEESRGDAAFVRSLCERLGIPCTVISIAPGKIAAAAKRKNLGLEAAARFYRRRALLREGRRVEAETGVPVRILTAHTRDDLLETALMRILRGAGPAGLAAMPPGRGRFARPLLALSRADVLRYLAEKNISWREDSTNADTRFLRNRIRHCLVPLLNESFPHWRTGLAALAETQSLAAAFISTEARRRVSWAAEGGGLCTGGETFFAQSAIIREEALFQGIDRLLAARMIPPPVKRAAVRGFSEGRVNAADLGPVRARREGGDLILSLKKNRASEYGFALLIKAPGLYTLKRVIIEVKPCSGNTAISAGCFHAALPLLVRRSFRDDCIVRSGKKIEARDWGKSRKRLLSVVDRQGTAAFIGAGDVICREEMARNDVWNGADAGQLWVVTISNNNTGGMNVQQSKQ
jgi:tRNA(Ile)-lysidine synthase